MINYEKMQDIIPKGLKDYVKYPVIMQNQAAPPPKYPYLSYTVTTLAGENKGTYEEYEDGTQKKSISQIWSISAQSNNESESVILASKAREWFDNVGTLYLKDNNIVVQSVGSITNRDNLLVIDYEYKKGFDVTFTIEDVIDGATINTEYIEATEIGGINIDKSPTTDELIERLAKRLDGEVV